MTNFLAIDGDDVGHKLEYYVLINVDFTFVLFFIFYTISMNCLVVKLSANFNVNIIFIGGDNLLASLNVDEPDHLSENLEKLRLEFSEKAQSTLSMGIGKCPREAYLALKLAKASGKNCIRLYEEFPND